MNDAKKIRLMEAEIQELQDFYFYIVASMTAEWRYKEGSPNDPYGPPNGGSPQRDILNTIYSTQEKLKEIRGWFADE